MLKQGIRKNLATWFPVLSLSGMTQLVTWLSKLLNPGIAPKSTNRLVVRKFTRLTGGRPPTVLRLLGGTRLS